MVADGVIRRSLCHGYSSADGGIQRWLGMTPHNGSGVERTGRLMGCVLQATKVLCRQEVQANYDCADWQE